MDNAYLKEAAFEISNVYRKGFKEGLKAGIRRYTYWDKGVQYVGNSSKTLKEALEEVDKQED